MFDFGWRYRLSNCSAVIVTIVIRLLSRWLPEAKFSSEPFVDILKQDRLELDGQTEGLRVRR